MIPGDCCPMNETSVSLLERLVSVEPDRRHGAALHWLEKSAGIDDAVLRTEIADQVCGILSDAVETPNGLAVILGIGINLKDDDPAENATSIERESVFPAVRDKVVVAVNKEIAKLYDVLQTAPDTIVEEWKRRSSYFEGKAVEVRSGSESFTGVTCGLEENGALRVRLANGSVRTVQAGDVESLRAKNDKCSLPDDD